MEYVLDVYDALIEERQATLSSDASNVHRSAFESVAVRQGCRIALRGDGGLKMDDPKYLAGETLR